MGYCEGGDLCTRLKSYRGILLSEHQVVEWFVQIALALQVLLVIINIYNSFDEFLFFLVVFT